MGEVTAGVFMSASGEENRFDFAWENGVEVMQDGEKASGGAAFSTAKSAGEHKGGDPLAWEVVDGNSGVSTGSSDSIAELAQANAVTESSTADKKADKKATATDEDKAGKAKTGEDKAGEAKAGAEDAEKATDRAMPVKSTGAADGDKAVADKKPATENLLNKKASAASISDLVGGDKKPAAGGTTAGTAPTSPMTTGGTTNDPMESIDGSAEEGFFIRGAQLNDVFQFLAQSGGLNYFHNAELAAPTYTVTGQLQDGDPVEQMKELGLMYGITIHTKGKTVYAMTESQLSQLPVKPFQYQMKYLRPADIDQIKAILAPLLTAGRGTVDFETKTNTLIVMDNEQKVDALKEILEQLDKPKRQVAIEMRILRVTSASRNRIGVDWSTVLGEDGIALGADSRLNNLFNLPDYDEAEQIITLTGDKFASVGSATGTVTNLAGIGSTVSSVTATNPGSTVIPSSGSTYTVSGVPIGAGGSATAGTGDSSQFDGQQRTLSDTRTIRRTNTGLIMDDVALDAVLRALNQGNLAEQESSPTLVTEDNEQAIISIIDRVPIIVATVNSTSAGTNVTEEVRYRIDVDDPVDDPANTREIGVTMSITPTILPDGTIRMVMRPRTAQIVEFVRGAGTVTSAGVIPGNEYPRVSESTVDTIARVPDGSSLLIGGFYDQRNRDQESKVPILGDIPWVNFFFKYTDKEKTITSIVFVVTPTAYDAESPQGTVEMTKQMHDRQIMPFDHNWPDRNNPGFNHEANLGRTLGNALKLYPEVPEWNPLSAENPMNIEKTEAAAAQQPPANHRKPRNPLIRIFGFGKTQE